MKIRFDSFCAQKDCPEYIIWELQDGLCFSCQKVGQSYNVDKYPDDCVYLEEIKQHKVEVEKAIAWERLSTEERK